MCEYYEISLAWNPAPSVPSHGLVTFNTLPLYTSPNRLRESPEKRLLSQGCSRSCKQTAIREYFRALLWVTR
jgi:hypothetical protein